MNKLNCGIDIDTLARAKKDGIVAIAVNSKNWLDKMHGNTYGSYCVSVKCAGDSWRVLIIGGSSYGGRDHCGQRAKSVMKNLGFNIDYSEWLETSQEVLKRDMYKCDDSVMTDLADIASDKGAY